MNAAAIAREAAARATSAMPARPETSRPEPWLRPLRAWPQELIRSLQHERVFVRIVLAVVRGSAPREAGTVMLVGHGGTLGTIGGGQLEWQALSLARGLLAEGSPPARAQRLVLGPELAQCCGGVVELWLERYTRADLALLQSMEQAARRGPALLISSLTAAGVLRRVVRQAAPGTALATLLQAQRAAAAPRLLRGAARLRLIERVDDGLPPLWLYGAGHVGQALARILTELPLSVTWIDSRAELLPANASDALRILHAPDPVSSVSTAPAGARFLILTHSHALDYALCRGILARGDFVWAGLIGSRSKAARFRARLAREGVAPELIARLVCPIGIEGIESKWPAAIAVGVAAQLLRDLNSANPPLDAVSAPPTPPTPPALPVAPAPHSTCAGEHCGGCDPTC